MVAEVRLTISELLDDEVYDVSTANDGFDALLHLEQAVPDLTLTCRNLLALK
jgi:CheY-like chemotaxis protein